jgi:hypothetical protein
MQFFPFRQPEVAAYLGWKRYYSSRGTLCECDRPATQAAGKLLAVCPDVAEIMAVVALSKTILSFIGLYPDWDVAEAFQSEKFLRFCRPRQGY